MEVSRSVKRYTPHLVMIISSLITAGFIVLLHSYISGGASATVFVAYEHILATLLLSSLAFFLEKGKRPPITFQTLSWAFFLGFLQIPLGQLLLTWSLRFVSATFQTILLNTNTAVVFVMAVVFRRETFRFCSINGQAKVWGISLSVLGTIAMVLYSRERVPQNHLSKNGFPATGERFIAYLANLVSLFALASLNVLLEQVTTTYQGDVSWSAMISFCGTLQTVAIATFTDRSSTAWKIRLEGSLQVLTILYGGIFMTGLCFYATTWCIHKKGPVFASAFGPLIIIFSFLLETNFRRKEVQFESIIGAALVVVGLYLLLWAKAKDSGSKKTSEGSGNSTTKSSLSPLLGDKLDSCA